MEHRRRATLARRDRRVVAAGQPRLRVCGPRARGAGARRGAARARRDLGAGRKRRHAGCQCCRVPRCPRSSRGALARRPRRSCWRKSGRAGGPPRGAGGRGRARGLRLWRYRPARPSASGSGHSIRRLPGPCRAASRRSWRASDLRAWPRDGAGADEPDRTQTRWVDRFVGMVRGPVTASATPPLAIIGLYPPTSRCRGHRPRAGSRCSSPLRGTSVRANLPGESWPARARAGHQPSSARTSARVSRWRAWSPAKRRTKWPAPAAA